MRIGLLGGTFNPIHNCHLSIAAQIRDRLNLERVLFIPSSDPPHKPSTSLAPAAHRHEMVRLAIASEPSFALSDVELKRANKSYSIDTVRTLRIEFGPSAELFFILG
jgi:nicotinate-nucleotide adenylyltransferase